MTDAVPASSSGLKVDEATNEVAPLLGGESVPPTTHYEEGVDDDDEESSEEQSTWDFVKESFRDMGRSFIDCPWATGSYIKFAIFLVVVAVFVLGLTVFQKYIKLFLHGYLEPFIQKIGWWGPFAYAGIYALLTPTFFPMSILSLSAGVVFPQIYVAIPTVWVGACFGLMLAFVLGRFAFKDWAQKKVNAYPVFVAMQSAIVSKGFLMILLLRLSPVVPFSVLNYVLSISGVSFLAYAGASALGILPGTALFVYISWSGTAALKSSSPANTLKNVLTFGVGGVATIAAVVVITFVARSQIKKELKKQRRAEREAKRVNSAAQSTIGL